MATKTLTVAAPAGTSCNGQLNPTEVIQVASLYPQAGIIGCKKRTLYVLLILLVSVVIINLVLILWIIKILDLTSEGPGRVHISEYGLEVDSDVEFLETLSARLVMANKDQNLRLESSRNVSVMALDRRGFVSNILSLGEAGFQAMGKYFTVRGTAGNDLLHVDSEQMIVAANHMVVSESGGLRLDGSLEAPLVRGSETKDLRLESLMKKVKIESEKGTISVNSPAGGISVTGLKTMHLKSRNSRVIIDSSRLQMKNLKLSGQTSKEKGFHEVYQVCACENGRLFLAHRNGLCQIHDSVCRGQAHDRYRKSDPHWRRS